MIVSRSDAITTRPDIQPGHFSETQGIESCAGVISEKSITSLSAKGAELRNYQFAIA